RSEPCTTVHGSDRVTRRRAADAHLDHLVDVARVYVRRGMARRARSAAGRRRWPLPHRRCPTALRHFTARFEALRASAGGR
ncbi:MAG: hypothetical protein ACRD0D_00800, partial [Acidimicrobiales bacterium]